MPARHIATVTLARLCVISIVYGMTWYARLMTKPGGASREIEQLDRAEIIFAVAVCAVFSALCLFFTRRWSSALKLTTVLFRDTGMAITGAGFLAPIIGFIAVVIGALLLSLGGVQ